MKIVKENKAFQVPSSPLLRKGQVSKTEKSRWSSQSSREYVMVTLTRAQGRGHKAERQICLWKMIFKAPGVMDTTLLVSEE